MDSHLQDAAGMEYHGKIPRAAFQACAPFWIRLMGDDRSTPTLQLMARGPSKWIKVSTYEMFLADCKTFAEDYMRGGSQTIQLKLVIQPYTPLEDAYNIYKHIFGLEMLPSSFSKCLELLKLAEEALCEGKDVDQQISHVFPEYNRSDIAPEELFQKEGSLSCDVDDKKISVQFLIVNHNLLLAKARKYCMFIFLRDCFRDLHSQVRICQKMISSPTSSSDLLIEPDYDMVEEAKRKLLFSMYRQNALCSYLLSPLSEVEPHNVIAELYGKSHDEIYGPYCPLCTLSLDIEGVGTRPPQEEDDLYDPHNLLLPALQNMGYDNNVDYPTVEDSQRNLMYEYGFLEAFAVHDDVTQEFFMEARQFCKKMETLVDKLEGITLTPSVIGVPSNFDDIEEVSDSGEDEAED